MVYDLLQGSLGSMPKYLTYVCWERKSNNKELSETQLPGMVCYMLCVCVCVCSLNSTLCCAVLWYGDGFGYGGGSRVMCVMCVMYVCAWKCIALFGLNRSMQSVVAANVCRADGKDFLKQNFDA